MDSEARRATRDPVCGMKVERATAHWRGLEENWYNVLGVGRSEARTLGEDHREAAVQTPTARAHEVDCRKELYYGRHEQALAACEAAIALDTAGPAGCGPPRAGGPSPPRTAPSRTREGSDESDHDGDADGAGRAGSPPRGRGSAQGVRGRGRAVSPAVDDAGRRMPPAMPEGRRALADLLGGRRPAVFLDYDGTLTPIVDTPDRAVLSGAMRDAVRRLAGLCTVAVVSGRDRADVARLVGLDDLAYAGSHGFDISGPGGLRIEHEKGAAFADAVARATERLEAALEGIAGALVEPKRFAVAVHYRQVAGEDVAAVEAAVARVLDAVPELRRTEGKKVIELRPRFDWDKGRAVLWLMDALGADGTGVLPVYLGDDVTDEDAFRALAGRGIGIVVGPPQGATAADYALEDPAAVGRFLDALADMLEDEAG